MARSPIHPGEHLTEALESLGVSPAELARAVQVPPNRITGILHERRAITADTALILARVFGNSADFWLNTQRRTDLWEAMNTPKRRIRIQRAKPIGSRKLAVA